MYVFLGVGGGGGGGGGGPQGGGGGGEGGAGATEGRVISRKWAQKGKGHTSL